jgi:ribosomal-protein-serine acetyltransferase
VSAPLFDLGDGVEVRVLEAGDADEVFALVDRERARLREWMPWVDGTESAEDTREFIEQSRRAEHDRDGLGLFVDGRYAGGIGLRVDVLQRNGELGYWIGSAWEGRGVVTRACEALIRYAFGDLALHRVSINVAPANARSRAIPERLGFTEEAVLRQAGRTDAQGFVDLVVYGLLEDEWASR